MNPFINGASHNTDTNNIDKKKKIVFVMGATLTGKSKLAVHLATHFEGEVINSDKIHVCNGLHTITNKPEATDFWHQALKTIHQVTEKGKIPIIVDGLNRFIEGFVENFALEIRSKFDCLFIRMDMAMPISYRYLDEVEEFYIPEAKYTRCIRRAIGILHRIDSTIMHQTKEKQAEEAWKEMVLKPTLAIVIKFLNKNEETIGRETVLVK